MYRFLRKYRRAVSTAQTALVLAIIAVGIIATVRSMSTATNTQLNVTSQGVSDPQVLRSHFSSSSDTGGSTP